MRNFAFVCPLVHGLHARPASRLREAAARFSCRVCLRNERTGRSADAKSVLALIAVDLRHDDPCSIEVAGPDEEAAATALAAFVARELPRSDEPIPAPEPVGTERSLPRPLRMIEFVYAAGIPAVPGVAMGSVALIRGARLEEGLREAPAGSCEVERRRIAEGLSRLRANLEKRIERSSGAARGVLQAHLAIADDPELVRRIEEEASLPGTSAARAVLSAAAFFVETLGASASAIVKERAADLQDVCGQLLAEMYGEQARAARTPRLEGRSIVVADSLAPSELLSLERAHIAGLALRAGGATSHAAIIARSFGVPTIVGLRAAKALRPGSEAILDGTAGILIPDPPEDVRRHYARERAAIARRREREAAIAREPALLADGSRLEVLANVSSGDEVAGAIEAGAEGVGLFRTEMLFMERGEPPGEEEQYEAYGRAIASARGRPVTLRLLDVGGDKVPCYLSLGPGAGGPLGRRGVRLYGELRELLRIQVRAVLRAAAQGSVKLLLPMVSWADEVRMVRALVAAVRSELAAAGKRHAAGVPLGVMVEVPAAAFSVASLAGEADFFSIGTNDLAQYFFAADREDDAQAPLCDPVSPPFFALLRQIVEAAHAAARPVGLCGEMAGDPSIAPLAIGLGLDWLSLPPPRIPLVKAAIRGASRSACVGLLQACLQCAGPGEVRATLEKAARPASAAALLEPALVVTASESRTKEEAVRELVGLLYAAGRTDRPDALEEAIWRREETYSTGLGWGFAIPHCKSDAVRASSIAVLKLARPIEWGSPDGAPVGIAILLAMPESEADRAHMDVFSRLARGLMHEEFRRGFAEAQGPEAILAHLERHLSETNRGAAHRAAASMEP